MALQVPTVKCKGKNKTCLSELDWQFIAVDRFRDCSICILLDYIRLLHVEKLVEPYRDETAIKSYNL